eukprot:CAMPEP_0184074950 /NCGR_PEP_ID=MMETSP0957-20130417/70854_1 /TAXON_ID=627963 /ORGANISM="Aplanochytrium sp, Strain PBS07" /LENGTH=568 /DNA_ID=CAMNT_0026377329 /DNA_START=127 /DNA_END=1834 /DNA_ORIENTATION=-
MENVLVRDNKKQVTGGISSVVNFILSCLIKLPLLLFVILPLGLVAELFRTIISLPFSLGKKKTTKAEDPNKYTLPEVDVEKQIPLESRKYDLVLYGCTGFTGRLAASYLAKNYGNGDLKWAIAGRRAGRLEEIRKELAQESQNDSLIDSVDIIVADSGKEDTLHDLVSNTRVVVSTVGPFLYYGTPVVKYCVAYGTSYADTTGEVHWVRDTIEHFQEAAIRTGARIVSLCGSDSIPWDLLAKLLADKLKAESNTDVKSFEFYNDMGGAVSGGTIATVISPLSVKAEKGSKGDPMNMLPSGELSSNRVYMSKSSKIGYSKTSKKWHSSAFMARVNQDVFKDQTLYWDMERKSPILKTVISALSVKAEKGSKGDPMNMLPSGELSSNRMYMNKSSKIGYSKTSKKWHSASFMASVNHRCVQRSNALLGYGKKISYFEVNNQANWFTARQTSIDLLFLGCFIGIRSLRKLAYSLGAIPLPGQGPSKEVQESGYLRVHGFAKGEDGTVVDGYIYFPQDPGYCSTARMVVESGLCMVLQAEELPVKGGFWSPAAGLGNILKERLEKTGTEFQI